jgi:hypothetical protein
VQIARNGVPVVQNKAGVLPSPILQPTDWKNLFQPLRLA